MATTQYTNTSGRRKTAVARVYLSEGTGQISINGRELSNYFPSLVLQYKVNQPFKLTGTEGKYDFKANLDGGGITGQAEAVRLAISKAIDGADLKTGLHCRSHKRPSRKRNN